MRRWLADIVVGGFIGAVLGAIVAVNIVIYTGIEGGYEASITDVFQQNTLVGVVTVAILVSGPLLGVATARRLRAKRDRRESQ
jgi:hypothetical protein